MMAVSGGECPSKGIETLFEERSGAPYSRERNVRRIADQIPSKEFASLFEEASPRQMGQAAS
jgi:hypothetical protein